MNNLISLSLVSLSLAAVSGTAFGRTDSLESATSPATAAASSPGTRTAIDAAAHAASAADPVLASIGAPSVEISSSVLASIDAADPADAAELADSQLTLTVVGPFGAQYHLVYTAGQGWQFVDAPSRSGIVKVSSDSAVAPSVAPTSGEIHPQTVFIDGPTGCTFVWVDGGWKFVGNITTAER